MRSAGNGYGVILDASMGEKLFTRPMDGFLGAVSYNPDGKQLAVGGKSGIYIFLLPDQGVIRLPSALSFLEIRRLALREIPGITFHIPVLRFLLVAHVLFPEQIVAGVIADTFPLWKRR